MNERERVFQSKSSKLIEHERFTITKHRVDENICEINDRCRAYVNELWRYGNADCRVYTPIFPPQVSPLPTSRRRRRRCRRRRRLGIKSETVVGFFRLFSRLNN
jgi:hypothetical protein